MQGGLNPSWLTRRKLGKESARVRTAPTRGNPRQGQRWALRENRSDNAGFEMRPHLVTVCPKRVRHWERGMTSDLKN